MATLDLTVPWYTIIAEMEDRERTHLLSLSAAEWKEERCRRLQTFRGRDIQDCVTSLAEVDRLRACPPPNPPRSAARRRASPFDRDFAVWRDVVEEPHKYGDATLARWLTLDAKLRSGPGRWRVEAYWFAKDQEEEDRRRAEEEERDASERAAQAPFRALYSRCAKEAAWKGERAWVHRDFQRHIAAYHRKVARETQAALLALPPTVCPGAGPVRCRPGTWVDRGARLCPGCACGAALEAEDRA
jgi:hypothetical protein